MSPIIEQVRARFNDAAGSVRVVAFLSPTCGPCRYGQGVVRALFEEFPDAKLAGLIIWVPMLAADNADTAAVEQDAITDVRVRCWFDRDKAAADLWSSFIGLPTTAWDVYAFYGPGVRWAEGAPPPSPDIWMHQLPPAPATQRADRLDSARLAREWLRLIGRDAGQGAELAARLDASGRAVSGRRDSGTPGFRV